MKFCKFYSLDECTEKKEVYKYLDELQNDSKIIYNIVDTDVIKIKDTGLTQKGIKEVLFKFSEYDVIDYPDFEDVYNEDSDDEDEDYEDEEF